MIRYLDSSALVKRYVEEEGSAKVRRLLGRAAAATARLSVVEIVSALARRSREGDLEAAELRRIVAAVHEDAGRLTMVELTTTVTERASELLLAHALRAADAVQLASCLLLRDQATPSVRLTTADRRLASAAEGEGIRVELVA